MLRFMKINLICTFLLVSFNCLAQKKITNITLTFNPLCFLDTDAGINAGAGFHFSKHFSFYADASFLFYSPYQFRNSFNNISGFKFKPAIRYFFGYKVEADIPKGGFIEGEFLFKHVKYSQYDEVRVADIFGNTAFRYIGGYTITKNVTGFTLKFGHRTYFDKKENFGADLYIGTGVKNRTLKNKGLPSGAIIDDFFYQGKALNIGPGEGRASANREIINLSLGIKLIYRFD